MIGQSNLKDMLELHCVATSPDMLAVGVKWQAIRIQFLVFYYVTKVHKVLMASLMNLCTQVSKQVYETSRLAWY